MWKRIAAWLFDGILLSVLIVGLAFLLSGLFGYDGYHETLDAAYARYETEYGITFQITEESYMTLTDAQRRSYDNAYAALTADAAAMHAYQMIINLTLVIATLGILLGILIMEFLVPLLLGNGQTLGKKIFSLCLVRPDGVRMNTMQLFVRTVLGKFTLEIMVPISIGFMIFWGYLGLAGTMVLGAFAILQLVLLCVTRTNSLLHDLMAGTAVVDITSQRIFESTEELIEYTKKIHAERAARQGY